MELSPGSQASPPPEQPEQQQPPAPPYGTDRGDQVLLAANVTFFSLAIIATIHRFVSRRIAGDRIKADDWTAVAALVWQSLFQLRRDLR